MKCLVTRLADVSLHKSLDPPIDNFIMQPYRIEYNRNIEVYFASSGHPVSWAGRRPISDILLTSSDVLHAYSSALQGFQD
jgi:hypothetical protein